MRIFQTFDSQRTGRNKIVKIVNLVIMFETLNVRSTKSFCHFAFLTLKNTCPISDRGTWDFSFHLQKGYLTEKYTRGTLWLHGKGLNQKEGRIFEEDNSHMSFRFHP